VCQRVPDELPPSPRNARSISPKRYNLKKIVTKPTMGSTPRFKESVEETVPGLCRLALCANRLSEAVMCFFWGVPQDQARTPRTLYLIPKAWSFAAVVDVAMLSPHRLQPPDLPASLNPQWPAALSFP
jgi:hypothetical protein